MPLSKVIDFCSSLMDMYIDIALWEDTGIIGFLEIPSKCPEGDLV